jgi:hypothetical protein
LNFHFLNLQHIIYQLFDRDSLGTFKDQYLLRPINPLRQLLLSEKNQVLPQLLFMYLYFKLKIRILSMITLFVKLSVFIQIDFELDYLFLLLAIFF